MQPLTGKTALVTGCSAPNGIGRAISRRLAKDGAFVLLTDQISDADTEARLQSHVDDIIASGGASAWMALDVTRPTQIEAAVAYLIDAHGQINVLVNNAGSIAGVGPFLASDPAHWESSFQVNLMGPMRLSQAVIPHMKSQGGGRIVNIGSTGSLGVHAGFGAYTTMKHGIVGLSKTIAAEFGPDGILCNTVCPGFINTDMHMAANTRLAGEQSLSLDEIKAKRYADVALRTAGQPDDIAAAVSYLAGPSGDYVTGINLPVTGGVPYGI